MSEHLLDQFEREIVVAYRNETYHVRDNGAVFRQPRPEQRRRRLDAVWTFGNPNRTTGYMNIGTAVVHRIVATAFHGSQPSEKYIVDHIDTNRRNNRSENLRWITRLDNILLNPVTLRRILLAYGSLDAFFANPSAESGVSASFDWMRTVSKAEAEESRARLLKWAESDQVPKGGALGEWVYANRGGGHSSNETIGDLNSLTPLATQRNWKTPTSFPLCPSSVDDNVLEEYSEALSFGKIFSQNEFGESKIVIAQHDNLVLSVVTNLGAESAKEWAVTKVIVENGRLAHESKGSFFTIQGAIKAHCKILDIALDDSIDDYT